MTQPAPRRALVDLDNIEFYRPQPSKSLPPESALSIPPILPPLSILPGAATRRALPRGDGALLFDRPYGWDSCCDPEVPNSFDVELARCANAASLATSSNTDSELTRGETSNETLDASMFSPKNQQACLATLEVQQVEKGLESPQNPIVKYALRIYRSGFNPQPCISHNEPSVDNQRCSSAPQNDDHDVNSCGILSSYVPHDTTDKPIGEHENNNNKDALADDPQQLKQNVSGQAFREGGPPLNCEQQPSVAVVDSVPDSQLYLETDISHSAEPTQTSVRQISPTPPRHMAAVTHGRERPSAITKPPRRESFEVAQARILERRNPRRRNRRDVAQHDHQTDWSGHEEGARLTKRRKRAPRPVGKVTNCTSSGPFGKSLHSSASAQSAKPCHSQDIFGHAILTVETHASGTAYFFSFEPNSPNELDAPQFRFPLGEPRRLTAPSSTRGSKHVQGSKKRRLPSKNDIPTTCVDFQTDLTLCTSIMLQDFLHHLADECNDSSHPGVRPRLRTGMSNDNGQES
ncbi:hypothetical protein ASPSYDRAFT_37662 [Aspergillus sydowii CBS 593.65]|uniref:Uncharacterized protein n=1 Tax=Aspergillus sydowii CBS 593.65 TaxID=1036612 RepID=A0A1L9SY39_9EURO|nr:uncharacterized protein ASPSYDRAFT_37662 [Aspergillus sydowii CBS 593.65]OJJ52066.1 hypothetical protein ASPSYDRAFT_37662 [Aspergillus sydowii CBS 593.65]